MEVWERVREQGPNHGLLRTGCRSTGVCQKGVVFRYRKDWQRLPPVSGVLWWLLEAPCGFGRLSPTCGGVPPPPRASTRRPARLSRTEVSVARWRRRIASGRGGDCRPPSVSVPSLLETSSFTAFRRVELRDGILGVVSLEKSGAVSNRWPSIRKGTIAGCGLVSPRPAFDRHLSGLPLDTIGARSCYYHEHWSCPRKPGARPTLTSCNSVRAMLGCASGPLVMTCGPQ